MHFVHAILYTFSLCFPSINMCKSLWHVQIRASGLCIHSIYLHMEESICGTVCTELHLHWSPLRVWPYKVSLQTCNSARFGSFSLQNKGRVTFWRNHDIILGNKSFEVYCSVAFPLIEEHENHRGGETSIGGQIQVQLSGAGVELVPKWVQVIAAGEIVLSTHTNNPVAAAQHHKLFAAVGLICSTDLSNKLIWLSGS